MSTTELSDDPCGCSVTDAPTPESDVSAKGAPIEITVVDTNPTQRDSIELVLKSWGHHVVGRAGTYPEAFDVIGRRRPQVALVGMDPPDGSGIQFVRRLLVAVPGIGVVLVLGRSSVHDLEEAKASGAHGIVLRAGAVAELARAVVVVGEGGRYVSPGVRRRVGLRGPQS